MNLFCKDLSKKDRVHSNRNLKRNSCLNRQIFSIKKYILLSNVDKVATIK